MTAICITSWKCGSLSSHLCDSTTYWKYCCTTCLMWDRLMRVLINDISSLQIGEDSKMAISPSLLWILPLDVSMSSSGKCHVVTLAIWQIFARTVRGVLYCLRRSIGWCQQIIVTMRTNSRRTSGSGDCSIFDSISWNALIALS